MAGTSAHSPCILWRRNIIVFARISMFWREFRCELARILYKITMKNLDFFIPKWSVGVQTFRDCSTLLSGHKRTGPPLPFWNRVQVKSYLPPQFHFLGTPFGGRYSWANRERFFAFQKILNHSSKWWKGVPRGAKKRDQRQKSLVKCLISMPNHTNATLT